MNTRPRPRPSRLTNLNPVTASPYQHTLPREETENLSEVKTKMTLQFTSELAGKVRAAFQMDGPIRGVVSLSAWVEEILQAKIDTLEDEHGPITPAPPRSVASGWNAR